MAPRPQRSVLDHLGRRGTVLLLLGVLWILTGIGVYVTPITTLPGETLIHEQLPLWIRVGSWVVTGAIAAAYALKRSHHRRDDTVGFLALVLMPAERAASFAYGFLIWALPGVPHGYGRGLIATAVWSAIVALIIIISGWREPTPTIADVLTATTPLPYPPADPDGPVPA